MKLTMLAIEKSDNAGVPQGVPFRWLAHHVKEVLLSSFPKGIIIDGSSKIQITCGPKGSDPQYNQVLGTSNYYVENFDFTRYYATSDVQRDDYLVETVESALLDMAARHGAPVGTASDIRDTVRKVRTLDFSLKLRIAKLCKSSPPLGLKAEVYRNVSRDDGEAWSLEIKKKGLDVPELLWLTDRPHYLDMTDYFKKAEWFEGRYRLCNRLGKVVYDYEPTGA